MATLRKLQRTLALGAMMLGVSSAMAADKPNLILMMADDLGWGDTGFNGNTIIKTPTLDKMAAEGAVLEQFYAAGPVCSPTRGTFLTGRHFWRYGIWTANKGHLPKEEITLGEVAQAQGYMTGHFGKWHLGTLSKTMSSKGPGRKPEINYAPAWEYGYDKTFVTESATQTWDPGEGKRSRNNPFFEDGETTMEGLKGGDGHVLMSRVIPFIEDAVKQDKPFMAVIWFHAPHADVLAGPDYLKMYEEYGTSGHYYGCITEMDDSIALMHAKLKELGVYDNTIQLYTSDNGPEGKDPKPGSRAAGVTGGLRDRKRSLHEGGVRVPTVAVWPNHIQAGSTIKVAGSTMDILPTVVSILGYEMPDDRPLDGIDLTPILKQDVTERSKPIPFRYGSTFGLIKGDYKLLTKSLGDCSQDELYNLKEDRGEQNNIAQDNPERIAAMKKEMAALQDSFANSHSGNDYVGVDYSPDSEFKPMGAEPAKAGKEKKKKGKK
ncbi:sulfatase family protein [Persicirhabdus sediminis]|uniref:Sulfatase-like hydrolase/transferase n=1 Tax=Persicirhabdus sediminis TaxID=454144 RepID=A0A8J7SFT4_9BACT|nr:sulfatase-like hydrolase/transferase [Persicirhabdus sediminis]MBK1789675.1 sulfatase-like hydrolase/transferase [Persicirhabdus sediminis]